MNSKTIPDHTAIRVALWRAMHVQCDSSPYVFEDELGLKLANPDENWRQRGDMHPQGTRGYRASIVGRARFIEDLLEEKINHGTYQYVILGAGLDTFVQRRPTLASKIKVYEIDEPQTQNWKKNRLHELGFNIPDYLKFVPVDFEAGESWLDKLKEAGLKLEEPVYVVSTGVAMYLTKEANMDTFKKIASLAPGSTLAMTFMLPPRLVEVQDRVAYEMVMERAAAAGTPFLSLFEPNEVLTMAKEAGFSEVRHVSRHDVIKKYFEGRADGLLPSSGEEFLVAKV
ncbi:MAG: class I SAM-dependent methyltransferase [Bacteriovoracaceae bacterium]